ncbi:hypothetical protein K1T71_001905 [Dendrolimus kikuchii]|uniref:Uncharacterized protein n=1 Tax=Dendrolimus kikuchii TaxID=765133 RepID=A0ACC1DGP6_9NEOP|nr:hypothetical protein K1T71_001905 [Dendrolimus kikuchii]
MVMQEGQQCTEDKFVVLVRAREGAGGARGGEEGGGAGVRRLLRSEHLRPRSVAPFAACSCTRARAPARAVLSAETPPTVCETPVARRGRPRARPPLRRCGAARAPPPLLAAVGCALRRPAGFLVSPGGL